MLLRPTNAADRTALQAIHAAAFGQAEEAELTLALLDAPDAQPVVSLLALGEGGSAHAVGHILFSAARVGDTPATILAPLAVHPDAQGKGVGSALVTEGLRRLREAGCGLAFVFGDPAYYGRFGFIPARPHGLRAPHPIPEPYADAWMVLALAPDLLDSTQGTVHCAAPLDKPELWQV